MADYLKIQPMSDIFEYPELPLDQKVHLEKRILNRPFEYRLAEFQHFLATSFPFGRWDRVWLERYCELAEHIAEKGHLRVHRGLSLGRWVVHSANSGAKERFRRTKRVP